MGLFITCDEATTICDKSQYGEASWFEKLKLQLHFIKCKICARYTKQNTVMTKICDHHLKDQQNKSEACLTEKEKKELKEQLAKHNQHD